MSLPCRMRASAGLVGALMAGPAWAHEKPGAEIATVSGEVLSVGVEDGTLFLDGDHGMEFLVVHPDAEIQEFGSRVALPLARIRPGDLIEYGTESANGMPLVRRLVVTPVGPREEPSRTPTHGPPLTAQCCSSARLILRRDDRSPQATVAGTASHVPGSSGGSRATPRAGTQLTTRPD